MARVRRWRDLETDGVAALQEQYFVRLAQRC
jgi:hypothetical protein